MADVAQSAAATSVSPAGMTPMQQRLFELRLKLNQCRKSNKEEVVKENLREKDPKGAEKQRARERWMEQQRELKEAAKERGEDPQEAKYLTITAHAAGVMKEKKRKKEKARERFLDPETDRHYNAYKKRVKRRKNELEKDYEDAKKEQPDFYREAHSLSHGTENTLKDTRVEKMVEELEECEERRNSYSRQRAFYDEKDVSYINERNRVYNEKIARAFDKYTVEIRENLERGTAL